MLHLQFGGVDVDGGLPIQRGKPLGHEGLFAIGQERLSTFGGRDSLSLGQCGLKISELGQERGGRLLPNSRNPGNVVGRISLQADEVGDLRRLDAESFVNRLGIVDTHICDAAGIGHYVNAIGHQLQGIAVSGHDQRRPPLPLGLAGEGSQDVVGLVAGETNIHKAERSGDLREKRPLFAQTFRHRFTLSLVFFELLAAEGRLLGVPGHHHHGRPVVGNDLDEHGAETVEGVGGETRAGGNFLGQGEEGAVGQVVAVD
ncbi:MAG: hypothetical protein BWY79_00464 [Actinobacteria bacterium ADurb.Bin444]|nr:MAG: hypothetical protein BWY79_00464 [Actinobacteria bacterium ADurb.Bin444]